ILLNKLFMERSFITKTTLTLLAVLFISTSVLAQSTWKVDPPHAKVTFSTVHNTISDVEGMFDQFEATVTATKKDFSDAVFKLTINVSSINTGVGARDNHLKSADFFNVKKYPAITYESTSIQETENESHYKLNGNLTIHGITKTVTMDLWYRGTIENPMNGAITAGFKVSGTINRSD